MISGDSVVSSLSGMALFPSQVKLRAKMEERNEKQDRNSRFSEGKVEKMNSQLKMGNLELGNEGDQDAVPLASLDTCRMSSSATLLQNPTCSGSGQVCPIWSLLRTTVTSDHTTVTLFSDSRT